MQHLRLTQLLRAAADDQPPQLAQRAQRRWAAGAVREQAVLPLEGLQGELGPRPEHAVDAAGVETELEDLLSEHLSTQVKVQETSGGGGKVVITFADLDDLERLYRAMAEPTVE